MRAINSRHHANLALLLVGFVMLCLLVGAGLDQNSLLAVLLCVPIAGIAIVLRPQIGLYAILIGVYSLDWLSRVLGLLPTQARWLPDLILLTLALVVILKTVLKRKGLRRTAIDVPFVALVILGTVSALISESSMLTALNGFRALLKPLLLFYVIINLDLSPRTLKHLVVLLIGLELLQIPISILQVRIYGAGDEVGGTLGQSATQIATLTALMAMSVLFGLATVSRRGWLYVLAGSSLFIPILLGEGKFGFFMAPLMVMFIFVQRTSNRIRTALIILVLLVIAFFVSLRALPVIAPRSQLADFLRSPALIFQVYEQPLAQTGVPMSRLGDIQFAIELIGRNPKALWLGYGPGEASPSFFGDLSGQLYEQYEYLGSIFAKTQISRALLEWGLIGILLYLFSIFRIYNISQRLLNRSGVEPFWKGITVGFRGVALVFVASTVYWYTWQSDAAAYFFWILAAAVYSLSRTGVPEEITHAR